MFRYAFFLERKVHTFLGLSVCVLGPKMLRLLYLHLSHLLSKLKTQQGDTKVNLLFFVNEKICKFYDRTGMS